MMSVLQSHTYILFSAESVFKDQVMFYVLIISYASDLARLKGVIF